MPGIHRRSRAQAKEKTRVNAKKVLLLSAVLFLISGKTAVPYPWNATYPYGMQATNASSSQVQAIYDDWASECITSSGAGGYRRVQTPGNTPPIDPPATDSISEGIGYGMLFAVYFSDQPLFNDLWNYEKLHLDSDGLMNWDITDTGAVRGYNSATDGDQDIAFSLVMADREWGSGTYCYLTNAAVEITKLKTYDCDASDYHLKPDDMWDGVEFPCYYMPAWYTEFGVVNPSEASFWANVENKCNSNLAAGRNQNTGLVAENLNHDGTVYGANTYWYNSCRVPWRYAIDYAWNGDSFSQTETNMLAVFFNNIGPSNILDGYDVATGAATGTDNNSAFVGPAACSLMSLSQTASNQNSLNGFYTWLNNYGYDGYYYDGALAIMSMLLMSGNFPKSFYTPTITPVVSPTPTSTISPVLSPTPTYTITPVPQPTLTPAPYYPAKGLMIYPDPLNRVNGLQNMTLRVNLSKQETYVWIRVYTFAMRKVFEGYETVPNTTAAGWQDIPLVNTRNYLISTGAANGLYYYTVCDLQNGNLNRISQAETFIILR